MRLSTLLSSIYPVDPSLDCELLGLAQNSQSIQPGYLFIACRGRTFDGRQYIDEAIRQGAIAVLADSEQQLPSLEWRGQVPILLLPALNTQLPQLAAQFYNTPVSQLQLLGVTGTNGKTSCSHFLAQSLQVLTHPCAVIGTLGNGMLGHLDETLMTTPDTVNLQKIFAKFVKEQVQYVAMEVSSHSLDQARIAGLGFEVGIFTNLTQDHLDYHGDMKAYAAAKKRFFTDYDLRCSVVNADDGFGQELIATLPKEKVLAYSTKAIPLAVPAVTVVEAHFELSGIRARVATPWGEGEFTAPLIGEFNLSNVLAVLASLCALGIPLNQVLSSLSALRPVPGRMQIFGNENTPSIVVDYSHTPDSLEKALQALRKHCQGELYCLFGCGGDRDKGKRPLMGAIAEQYADHIMVTSDNPRHEDPATIIAEIVAGLKHPEQARIQGNRSQAIQDIIQCARVGDYVLIAGKGAESYQQIGDLKLPFSDVQRVAEVLAV